MALVKSKSIAIERYRFIELLAYWEGKINNPMLQAQFGLSRQQSSANFSDYQKQAHNTLLYNSSQKVYLPQPDFKPAFISTKVEEYLEWLQFGRMRPLSAAPGCEVVAPPSRQVDPLIMRSLVQSIRQKRRVEVEYISLSNPNDQGRIIAPHSFVNAGVRWHLRAYCEKSKAYRDFVLSRFCGQAELLDKSSNSATRDEGWNTTVTIILQPDPRLSPLQKQVLENDYQMVNGQLRITTKGCLVNYLLRELQVNIKVLDGVAEAQQLVLVNFVDIKDWLFE